METIFPTFFYKKHYFCPVSLRFGTLNDIIFNNYKSFNFMKTMSITRFIATALLLSSLSVSAATWDKPVPSGSTLVNGERFFIYNNSAEKFLDTRGEKVAFADEGDTITFIQQADGDWKLRGSNGYMYADLEYVGCDGSDEEANSLWYAEKQAGGYYWLRPSKNDPDFLWANYPDMWTGLAWASWSVAPIIKSTDGDINWYVLSLKEYEDFQSKLALHRLMTEMQGYGYDVTQLLSVYQNGKGKDDYDAAIASVQDELEQLRLENASDDKPYDVTSMYLRNADLTENWEDGGHDVPGWTMVPASFCGMGEFDNEGFYPDNKTLGSWAAAAFGDNKVYQQLTGLRNGKYRFGNYGLWIRHTGQEGDPIKGAYIYAKVGDKLYQQPLADTGWWRGLSEVVFECRTGEAEVGIMFEGTNVGQCVILDFKLEFLGESSVADRLNDLIAKAQALIDADAINDTYLETLSNDIKKANELIASGDAPAGETLFATFEKDYDEALANQEAYVKLLALMEKAQETLAMGDSDDMSLLSDYLIDNDLEMGTKNHEYDNARIDAILKDLTNLIDKAANSVVAAGTDVTDLLINGHFDTTGGWTATLNDFSINPDLKIMERWWADWKGEQVVENVPNGTYRLEVQGFQWCHWDWSGADADWAAGDGSYNLNVKSKVRLNDNEVSIYNVFACGETDITQGFQTSAGYYVPNDATTALLFFERGLYNNVVEATVSDNTLKVEFDCSQNGFWNCFYNLHLIYVGADTQEAFAKLKDAMADANQVLPQKMEGNLRKAIEEALASASDILADKDSKYDVINKATRNILSLVNQATASAKEYSRLNAALDLAADALKDATAAQTEAGKQLQALYNSSKADYDSEYPTFNDETLSSTIDQIEALITQAKIGSGIKDGDDLTALIINPSFENTYGNDISVGGATHNTPYGWSMTVEGKLCLTAQELYDAGINSFTAIEENKYTTDGNYSYCLLSAPVPDSYLWQTIKGLPGGTYRVSVDMNVTYEGGCSRLTGQRLLVNNVAQYYGKPEFYIESELDNLHPEEVARTFAGYDEVNSTETGEAGDMGNMTTLSVDVFIADGQALTLGVRTDNNKSAMNRNYDENWWDCCGRFKIDNFRLMCVSTDVTGIETVESKSTAKGDAYNLMGIKVDPETVRGIYIQNGKKYIRK